MVASVAATALMSAVAPVAPSAPAGAADATRGVGPAAADGGAGFASTLASAVDQVQALQGQSDTLAVQAVTGDLTDIHQATIAATRAELAVELASAVRNQGVSAFNQIMGMQA